MRRSVKHIVLGSCIALSGVLQAATMEFSDFIKISRGMKETEVIEIAGMPDYVTDDRTTMIRRNDNNPSTKPTNRPNNKGNYTDRYINTKEMVWAADGYGTYTTTITIRDGRVTEIERKKKM